MADETSLLFKIRADNAQAKATLADTRAAIASLRTSFSSELSQMEAASQKAFGTIQGNLQNFVGRLPGGNIFVNITDGLRGLSSQSDKVTPALTKFNKTVDDLSKSTGKSHGELVKFLGEFVKLPNAMDRSIAGYIKFGSKFDELEPKLVAAGKQLAGLAGETVAVGASFSALAGPIGIAVLAIGAQIAAVALLAKGIFSLAQEAAAFRGQLFDLSQQTDVSVETLNALEIGVSKIGGSLSSVTQSLVIFQGHLDEAQDSESKSAELFDRLGISINDTETALRDAFRALAVMPAGFERTNTAAELFGKRGGKQFLAIIKETNGDLDSAVDKLGALARVTEEEARQADEFNDTLRDLTILTRGLGSEAIPPVLDALEDLREMLKDNSGAMVVLKSAVEATAALFASTLKLAVISVNVAFEQARPILETIASLYERIAGASQDVKPLPLPLSGVTGGAGGIFGNVGGGELTEPEILASPGSQAQEAARKEAEAARKQRAAELKRDLEGQLAAFQALTKELGEAADAYAGVDITTRSYAVAQSIANGELKNASIGLQQMARDAAANIDQVNKDLKLRQEVLDFQEKMNEAVRQAIEGDKTYRQLTQEFIDLQREKGNIIDGTTRRWLALQAQILDTQKALEMYKETVEAIMLPESLIPSISITADELARAAGAAADLAAGLPPEAQVNSLAEAFERLADAMSRVFGISKDNARDFTDILQGAIDDMAFGIGNLVENWVLLGTTGPQAMRRLVASVLAGVAAQAAVKAVYELAEGFAALFFNPPAAAAHFTAAALFGSLAGVAAVAGRGVAGDAFQRPDRGGRGGASSSGPSALDTITQNRNQRQGIDLHITVDENLFGRAIKTTIKQDFKDGGEMRELYANDGG